MTSNRTSYSTDGPIVVDAGSYSVDAYLVDEVSTFNPVDVDIGYPHCSADITVTANGFAAVTATFGQDNCTVQTYSYGTEPNS